MACIYKIVHIESGKTYVGQTRRAPEMRWKEHVKYSRKVDSDYYSCLSRAIRLHGLDSMRFEVIEECDENELNERERYWIKTLNCIAPLGYNITEGGDQPKLNDEAIARIRERAKDPEWKKRVSEGTRLGQSKMTDEKKKEAAMKVSAKTKGRCNWWCIGKKPTLPSEETRRLVAEMKRGKPLTYTPESKARQIESHSGFNSHRCNLTEETMQELLSLYDPEARPKMKHYNDLAARFGISEVTVRRIVKGNHWYSTQSASSIEQPCLESQEQTPTSHPE